MFSHGMILCCRLSQLPFSIITHFFISVRDIFRNYRKITTTRSSTRPSPAPDRSSKLSTRHITTTHIPLIYFLKIKCHPYPDYFKFEFTVRKKEREYTCANVNIQQHVFYVPRYWVKTDFIVNIFNTRLMDSSAIS